MKIIVFLILSLLYINPVNAKEKVIFDSCVDGDTFHVIINKEKQTIRMLSVDAPESVHTKKDVEYYGKESSEYTCNKIKNAKTIEIEYEKNSSKTDHYGRLTVWVFIDGKLFQKELLENGYAKTAYLYDDYKYIEELKKAEQLAKENKIGIWSDYKEEPLYSIKEIIIIIVLIIVILFLNSKKITKKVKNMLKKYFKQYNLDKNNK